MGGTFYSYHGEILSKNMATLGNSCFNSGQLFSGPCEDWFQKRQIQDGDVKPDELRLIITALKSRENIRNCNFKPINEMNTS